MWPPFCCSVPRAVAGRSNQAIASRGVAHPAVTAEGIFEDELIFQCEPAHIVDLCWRRASFENAFAAETANCITVKGGRNHDPALIGSCKVPATSAGELLQLQLALVHFPVVVRSHGRLYMLPFIIIEPLNPDVRRYPRSNSPDFAGVLIGPEDVHATSA